MIYSCFDSNAGLYQYFEDAKGHPINGDLPIPSYSSGSSRIGVASIEAARPFPRGAKPIGSGWRARGVIVTCPGRSTTLGAFDTDKGVGLVAAVVLVGLFAAYAWRN